MSKVMVPGGKWVEPVCPYCGKSPDQLDEYVDMGRENKMSPSAFVAMFEGTFNRENGHFACTPCYVDIGMPTNNGKGWVAP